MKTFHLRTATALLLLLAANLRAAADRRSSQIDLGEDRYQIVRGPSAALHIPACGGLPGSKQFTK